MEARPGIPGGRKGGAKEDVPPREEGGGLEAGRGLLEELGPPWEPPAPAEPDSLPAAPAPRGHLLSRCAGLGGPPSETNLFF